MTTGSGLDLAYYSLNGTPDHQPVPHRLLASSMGRSLDEAFDVTAYQYTAACHTDTTRIVHHRTSSQPSHVTRQHDIMADNGQYILALFFNSLMMFIRDNIVFVVVNVIESARMYVYWPMNQIRK